MARQSSLESSRFGGLGWSPALGLALLLALAGCSAGAPPRQSRFWADAYVFGTLGERQFDVRDVCGPRAVKRVEVVATPTTAVISIVTLGFYTPREVAIECR